MADQRIQHTEKMVGAGHPTESDTINRLALIEHNTDGTHKSPLSNFVSEHNTDGTHKSPLSNFVAEHNTDGTHNKLTKVTDPWVDVRAYGAVGDGVTDDTAAIQNAINALSQGSALVPSTGSYYKITSALTGKNNVSLVGMGYGSRIHRAMGASGTQILNWDGISNSFIKDLRITGDVATPNQANNRGGITVTQSGSPSSRSSNVRVENVWIDGVDVGVSLGGATENSGVNNSRIGPTVSIGVMMGAGGVVPGGLAPQGHIASGNTIEVSTADAGACAIYIAGSSKKMTASDNVIKNGTYGIQFYIISTTEQDSEGHVIKGNKIYDTLKDGILASVNHATLHIKDVTVSDNVLYSCGESGIFVKGVEYWKITGNDIYGATNHGIGLGYYSTTSRYSQYNTVTGNTVHSGGTGGWGIMVEGANYNIISSNIVVDRAADGIRLQGSVSTTENVLLGNIVYSNEGWGIYNNATSNAIIGLSNRVTLNVLGNITNNSSAGGFVQIYGSAAPAAGVWRIGDQVVNTAPAASGNIGWVCTANGTPGTWKTFGTIQA